MTFTSTTCERHMLFYFKKSLRFVCCRNYYRYRKIVKQKFIAKYYLHISQDTEIDIHIDQGERHMLFKKNPRFVCFRNYYRYREIVKQQFLAKYYLQISRPKLTICRNYCPQKIGFKWCPSKQTESTIKTIIMIVYKWCYTL